jgi:hypothetical protein
MAAVDPGPLDFQSPHESAFSSLNPEEPMFGQVLAVNGAKQVLNLPF